MDSPDAPPLGAPPLYRAAFVELTGHLPSCRARSVLDQALEEAGIHLGSASAQEARVALFLYLPTVLEGVLRPGSVAMLLEALGDHLDALLEGVAALEPDLLDEPTERMRRADLPFEVRPEPELASSVTSDQEDTQPFYRSGVHRRVRLD